jgi:hypothetical protein
MRRHTTGQSLALQLGAEQARHQEAKQAIRALAKERQQVVQDRLAELEAEAQVLNNVAAAAR